MTASSSLSRAVLLVTLAMATTVLDLLGGAALVLDPSWQRTFDMVTLVALGVAAWQAIAAQRTLHAVAKLLQAAASGNLGGRLLRIREGGALGDLMHACNMLLDRTDAFVREAGASLEYVSSGRYFRRIVPEGLVGEFAKAAAIVNGATHAMGERIEGFGGLTSRFDHNAVAVADGVTDAASRLRDVAEQVAGSTRETTRDVEGVASAAEELSASINEIGRQVTRSTEVASAAVEAARAASTTVAELDQAATRIDRVVTLIREVAEQTNLLALNATIEAARAGEAGRGFAVVAGEVKALAGQSAKATDEIRAQIDQIAGAAARAVSAVAGIHERIEESRSVATMIATAVEEQNAATREIAERVQSAAQAVARVGTAVGAAGQADGSFTLTHAVEQLAGQATTLRDEVGTYLTAVRKVTGSAAA